MNPNITNSPCLFNHYTVMGGYQKAAAGEHQATVYVLTSKLKQKINACKFLENKMRNIDVCIRLCDIVEKWNVARTFKFFELYDNIYKSFSPKKLKKKIIEVSRIKITEKKQKEKEEY